MRRWICVAVAAAFLAVTLEAGQRPYMVFWNLENYFDPFDDSLTVDEEFTPGGYKHYTWKKFLVKRNLIAKTLLSMHDRYGDFPVLAAFAEVENRMVLRQLVEQTPLAKLGYGIIHRDSPDSRGIDVVLRACWPGLGTPSIYLSIIGPRSSVETSIPGLSGRRPRILCAGPCLG